jgi:hypothetical protein
MKLEFIIPTFSRDVELRSMLASLITQTDKEWIAHIIQDSDPADERTAAMAHSILMDINDDRFRLSYMDKRYNDYGYTPREYGKSVSTADYVCLTNDDNYYMPTFVKEIKLAAKDAPGMIYCDMVHSHYNYHYFKCSPAYNQIDMGAFATRTDLAKQIKLNTTFAADGEFVEEFKKRFSNEKIVKIDKVLFVHN